MVHKYYATICLNVFVVDSIIFSGVATIYRYTHTVLTANFIYQSIYQAIHLFIPRVYDLAL